MIRVSFRKRDGLAHFLRENGVEILIHWPKPMWEHEGLALGPHHLPETEAICREVLSLPMHAEISDENVACVVETVRRFYGE